ncbi:MAG: hypothetical protein JWO42_2759 [Chloroflexi bacterium]|jgi:hypothetical protein|nr:hypothetical protein [Chloroflexota bacterium]
MFEEATATHPADAAAVAMSAAFCEACERLIFVRVLLEDPRHQTRRQGSAVTRLLREGLRGVERQLEATRPIVFGPGQRSSESAPAAIGLAVTALRQVHIQLGLLGTRWPLGTADLFIRKLVAEGLPVTVPTICPTNQYDDTATEVGESFRNRLAATGLVVKSEAQDTPILTIPTMDLIDPLSWATMLYPLAASMVEARGIAAQLRRPSSIDSAAYRRVCTAGFAARLVGESTFAARAARTLLDRLSGAEGCTDISLLAVASQQFAKPISPKCGTTVAEYFDAILATQAVLARVWGVTRVDAPLPVTAAEWEDVDQFLKAELRDPLLPTPDEAEALFELLCDGRPINAMPPKLPDDFGERLDASVDAERFYDVLQYANERPCSLATILTVGWRYKVRRSYGLCNELMSGGTSWRAAIDALSGHVLERCSLLQQSIEAAYVQQVFSRWRDS